MDTDYICLDINHSYDNRETVLRQICNHSSWLFTAVTCCLHFHHYSVLVCELLVHEICIERDRTINNRKYIMYVYLIPLRSCMRSFNFNSSFQSYQKAMESKRDKSICDLTALWLNLDELNKEFDAIHSVLFLACFSNAIFSAVSLLYSFFNFTIFGTNEVASLSYLLSAIISIMVVALFCECADSLGKAVSKMLIFST